MNDDARQATARRIWRRLLRLEAALIGAQREDLARLASDARVELEQLTGAPGPAR